MIVADAGIALWALHESGHAVMGVAVGRRFAWVEVRNGGLVQSPAQAPRATRLRTALAGVIAERLAHLDHVTWGTALDGCQADLAMAAATSRSRDEVAAAIEDTASALSCRWLAVERVAERLVERGRLSYPEVERLVNACRHASTPRHRWCHAHWTELLAAVETARTEVRHAA